MPWIFYARAMTLFDRFLKAAHRPSLETAARAPKVSPSKLTAGTWARVVGIAESGGDLVRAPFSSEECVFWFARAEEKRLVDRQNTWGTPAGGDPVMSWVEAFRDLSKAPFWVVDETGARVHVDLERAVSGVDGPDVSDLPRLSALDPELEAYLRKNGVVPVEFMGISGDFRFHEARVHRGSSISVYGLVEEASVEVAGAYRDGPARVLRLTGTDDAPLVVLTA
jgi:hypothetical protein